MLAIICKHGILKIERMGHMEKISSIYGRMPTRLKRRFLKALNILGHTQQYVLIKMVNKTIEEASNRDEEED